MFDGITVDALPAAEAPKYDREIMLLTAGVVPYGNGSLNDKEYHL